MSAKLFSLKGKVALITGATNGIGQAMAVGLYEAGATVILTHRPATSPTKTVNMLKAANPTSEASVHTVDCDFADLKLSDIKSKVVDPALELSPTGQIDILINNAGVQYRSDFINFPEEEFYRVLHINLHVPIELTKLVGAHMIERGIHGKVVSTASLTSFIGIPNGSAYATSKGAILQFTKSIAIEWATKNINVNCIGPGYITTNITASLAKIKDRNDGIVSRIPQGRWGLPDDFKGPVVFLCSKASDYVTGECLMVDGGWMAN